MLRRLLSSLALTALLLAMPGRWAAAYGEVVQFDHLTVADGLAQNTVTAFAQDALGYLWIGTPEGLNRSDGYQLITYRADPQDPAALSHSAVTALLAGRDGRLWIGTGDGLNEWLPGEGRFRRWPAGAPGFVRVGALAQDGAGRVWVGAADGGLWFLDPALPDQPPVRQALEPFGGAPVQALLYAADENALWIGTGRGLGRLDLASGQLTAHFHRSTDPNTPSDDRINALLLAPDGGLWIATEHGLNRLDRASGAYSFWMSSVIGTNSLIDNRVRALALDGQGSLWAGTPAGLSRLSPDGRWTRWMAQPGVPGALQGSQARALLADRSGVLWVGMEGAGLHRLRPAAHRFPLYRPPAAGFPAPPPMIHGLAEDEHGVIWVATYESGLYRFDPRTGQWTTYRPDPHDPASLSSSSITSLLIDREGFVWAGTFGSGLNRLDPTTGRVTHYRYAYTDPNSLSSNTITALAQTADGAIWAGTVEAGLNRLDLDTGQVRRFPANPNDPAALPDGYVTALFAGPDGGLWVGTFAGGLARLAPGAAGFTRFRHIPGDSASLSDDEVTSLWEDARGYLWVGTKAGLDRRSPDGSGFAHWTARDGLPAGSVVCVRSEPRGALWVATSTGLARLDLAAGAVQAFSVEDGLQSSEFTNGACAQGVDGALLFGGVGGFNRFSPQQALAAGSPPQLAVTTARAGSRVVGQDLVDGAALTLRPPDNQIAFEFAALDYDDPARTRYQVRMDGVDSDWVEPAAGSRVAGYTNLRGGRYQFHVRAANAFGVWSDPGIAVTVQVIPPLWGTTGFRAAAALLLAGLAFGAYRWRVALIERRSRALERRVAELSEQVRAGAVAAERSRMARDLHDSVTQSLYSLTLLAEAGARSAEAGETEACQDSLRRLGEIARQALQEMRLLLYQLRQPALEQAGLAGALEHRLEAVERRAGVQARLVCPANLCLDSAQSQELYYLAQEALNNALKHANADQVTIHLEQSGGCLTLLIQDNGRGFEPATVRSGGLGLASMRERAQKLGGRLAIQSAPGQGTSVLFTLPAAEGDQP